MLGGGGRAFFYKIFKQLFSRDLIPILYYRMTFEFVNVTEELYRFSKR